MNLLQCVDWEQLPSEWPVWCREDPALEVWQAVSGDVRGWRLYSSAIPGGQMLQPTTDLAGPDAGRVALFHYVVETDVPDAALADFNAWYETEHMPGLARVPGTIRASRYVRTVGSPRFVACYDLVTPAAMEREEWLAVRHTDWSSRVRPQFRNTFRTLYQRHDLTAA